MVKIFTISAQMSCRSGKTCHRLKVVSDEIIYFILSQNFFLIELPKHKINFSPSFGAVDNFFGSGGFMNSQQI